MTCFPDLATRRLEPELMDQPGLDPLEHRHALRGLKRLHAFNATTSALWSVIAPIARAHQSQHPNAPLRILDLASGGGDILLNLARKARSQKLSITFAACDFNPFALEETQAKARILGIPIDLFTLDLLANPLPPGYDIITCTLFLHHIPDHLLPSFLNRMIQAARLRAVISDLRRSLLSWLLVNLGARLVTRSPIVHIDGPRSVAASLTLDEIHALAQQSGWHSFQLRRQGPCSYLLVGTP
jgi:2-polyprenyl-3-methyl-5-hydroxy-6-metoxy-1,4-benzoquinol methylase